MDGKERREEILQILNNSEEPVSGSGLAKRLNVSRQVIVQDIALLRAVNKNILSTTKGYRIYYQEDQKVNRCFLVKHTKEEIQDELYAIVDLGGKVLDVIVSHEIYGDINVDLIIGNRLDVDEFIKIVAAGDAKPLKELTNGIHLHTVEADNEAALDRIEQALKEKNYLYSD